MPAAFIPFFRRIFFMAIAMKIHLKKNAAANGLELKKRLQGLTATDVTHNRKSKAAILIFYIWPHKYCEYPPSLIKNIDCLSTPEIRQGFQLTPICIVR